MKNWQSFVVIFSGCILTVLTFAFFLRSDLMQEGPLSRAVSRRSPASLTADVLGVSNQISSISDSASLATTTTTLASSTKIIYQYKMLYNGGECGLNKFGKQGWQALQFGTPTQGQDYACGNVASFGTTFDWVLLQLQQ